jgi:predicted TIM-barrel fold metal-dependent hydrolase
VRFSAESYVAEPGDLWTAGLPPRFRESALRLDETDDGYRWVHPDGRPVSELDDPSERSAAGTTGADLLAGLDRDAIAGAVLYPSVAARAYAACPDSDLLDAVLDAYNEWVLALAATDRDRLKPVVLLNVDEPAAAVERLRRLAGRGAAGFVLPAAPGRGHRYDRRRFEVLWRAAAEVGLPLSLLIGSGRAGTPPGRTVDAAAPAESPADATPTTASVLAFHATSVFPARRSLTAMIFAGVFERHRGLRIGAVGFGASWAAYAMIRAEEMYEVRPERAGPPTRMPPSIPVPDTRAVEAARPAGLAGARAPAQGEEPDTGAITGDDRTGTRGMAPEGVGYYFPPGERFGDHFRRSVFLTFRRDELVVDLREHLGPDALLWGQGRPEAPAEQEARGSLDDFLAGLPEPDRDRLVRDNAARLYGFDPAARNGRTR